MKILKKEKKKKGFTLIELIAVVAILIILAVILVPNIVGYVNKSKIATVKSNAKVVLNIIRTAKANSDNAAGITNYSEAIDNTKGGDSTLKPANSIPSGLTNVDENTLQNIISDNNTTWSDFSSYYQK